MRWLPNSQWPQEFPEPQLQPASNTCPTNKREVIVGDSGTRACGAGQPEVKRPVAWFAMPPRPWRPQLPCLAPGCGTANRLHPVVATTESAQLRRLAAIAVTDVVGYSTMMSEDEDGTLAVLQAHLIELDPVLRNHGARIVKGTGDGMLIERLLELAKGSAAVRAGAPARDRSINPRFVCRHRPPQVQLRPRSRRRRDRRLR